MADSIQRGWETDEEPDEQWKGVKGKGVKTLRGEGEGDVADNPLS